MLLLRCRSRTVSRLVDVEKENSGSDQMASFHTDPLYLLSSLKRIKSIEDAKFKMAKEDKRHKVWARAPFYIPYILPISS